jgi:hypothetical protein
VILLLAACGARQAPELWTAPPDPSPPAPLAVEHLDGDCEGVRDLGPGDPAECVGVLVAPVRFAELREAEILAEFWSESWETERAYRLSDREYAQDAYGTCWLDREELRRESAAARWVVPLALLGGVVLGVVAEEGARAIVSP